MHRIAIPDVPTAQLPAELREVARNGALVNVFRIMLCSPQIATRVVELGAARRSSGRARCRPPTANCRFSPQGPVFAQPTRSHNTKGSPSPSA